MGINSRTPFNIGLYNETSCGNAWPVLHRLASLPHLSTVYKGSSHPKHTPSLCRYMYRWLHIFLPTIELYQDSWPDDLKVSGYRPSQEKMKRCIFSRSCYFVYGFWLFAFDYYFFLISLDFTLMNGISVYFPTYSFFLPLGFFFFVGIFQHFSQISLIQFQQSYLYSSEGVLMPLLFEYLCVLFYCYTMFSNILECIRLS